MATGKIDWGAPFMINSRVPGRSQPYQDEPGIIAQFGRGELKARSRPNGMTRAGIGNLCPRRVIVFQVPLRPACRNERSADNYFGIPRSIFRMSFLASWGLSIRPIAGQGTMAAAVVSSFRPSLNLAPRSTSVTAARKRASNRL